MTCCEMAAGIPSHKDRDGGVQASNLWGRPRDGSHVTCNLVGGSGIWGDERVAVA